LDKLNNGGGRSINGGKTKNDAQAKEEEGGGKRKDAPRYPALNEVKRIRKDKKRTIEPKGGRGGVRKKRFFLVWGRERTSDFMPGQLVRLTIKHCK